MNKRDEDSATGAIWSSSDKSTVLLEARAFNESPLNPAKCRAIISRLILLIYQAAPLTTIEATDIFFNITKLFMNNSVPLRQMVYLAIKELAPIANDILMVTSSLTKDMNAKADAVYRPNAIRALCRITDASLIQGIERFIKQAIVDKIPAVSSAAIVCSFYLYTLNKEFVKRWVNEVQEAISSKGLITQYHAVGLLFLIKHNDRMGIIKLIQNCSKMSLRSPHANCMLIRYICKIIDEEPSSGQIPMFAILEGYLRHKSDIVVLEAAKNICLLKNATGKELTPAVSALQLMLVSHKPTLRFAAIRVLNQLSMTHPHAVWSCNLDVENLISDPNRSIATFAITTLLKTGTVTSVDRLMKQINTFMNEISDEFKIIVIDAVRTLCLKFPSKQSTMLTFLSANLREEGGYEFKKGIVEAIFDIIHHIPDSIQDALGHLCEYIEDCEYTKLAVRILHLIGSEGPSTPHPAKYIRFIYNRVILENSAVRAAAVSAMAKFAVANIELRGRLHVLLTRCLDDADDEVRDRAAMFLKVIYEKDLAEKYVRDESTYSYASLENGLVSYLANTTAHSKPFDLSLIPIISKAQIQGEQLKQKIIAQESITNVPIASATTSSSVRRTDFDLNYNKILEKIPSLAALGTILKSSKVVELTEKDVEYVVSCVKHIFSKHIVFQFDIKNTIQNTRLENITVSMKENEEVTLKPCFVLPLLNCEFDQVGTCYMVYEKPDFPLVSFSNTLKFTMKEVDDSGEADEGYEDEYIVEDIDIEIGDYILPLYGDFAKLWKSTEIHEVVETYSLSAVSNLKAATEQIISILSMNVHDNGDQVADKATTHALLLSGTFIGGLNTCVKCRMALDGGNGVTLEITVRSTSEEVAELIANSVC